MALYHFSAKIITRSNGKSAVGSAAYRSGEKLTNEYDGITHDYRKKQNVEYATVMLPPSAPPQFADREKLWNVVEQTEKQANAQLAREIEFSLPRELPTEVRRQIALDFVQEQFVDQGMVADVCFHNRPKMDSRKRPLDAEGKITKDSSRYVYNNPHCHVMLPLRPIDDQGKWEPKKQKLYICEKDGITKNFSPQELKENPGWEKLYNYINPEGKKAWLTKSYVEAHPEKSLELVNRYPKCEQAVNPKVEKWNSNEQLIAWREAWAEKVNAAYEAYAMEERIDHRSYKDQGVDLIPTHHEGKEVTVLEKKLREEYERKIANGEPAVLQHTEIRGLNIAIQQHNEEVRIVTELKKLRAELKLLMDPIRERYQKLKQGIAEKLEHVRAKIITIKVRLKRLISVKGEADEKMLSNKNFISDLKPAGEDRLETLRSESRALKKNLDSVSGLFMVKKKAEMEEKLKLVDTEIAVQEENRKYAAKAQKEIERLQVVSDQAGDQIVELKASYRDRIREYHSLEDQVPDEDKEKVKAERLSIRKSVEEKYIDPKEKSTFNLEAGKVDGELRCSISDLSGDKQQRKVTRKMN